MENLWGYELVFPEDVLYSTELLWVKKENGKIRAGLSDIIVRSAKKLVTIKMTCEAGTSINKGDVIGTVETSKAVREIIAPVSGTVTSVNPSISGGDPATIMKDPYGDGWLIEIEKTGDTDTQLQDLMKGDEEETKEWLEEQADDIVPMA
ncbi:MAG: glycine cleavage system protein H [Proteobacteria bacterium]|nr:glycine cleavage system protein H [Pseudomonadota bacterium]